MLRKIPCLEKKLFNVINKKKTYRQFYWTINGKTFKWLHYIET